MREVDGVVISVDMSRYNQGTARLEGAFEVSSETRTRYGNKATSLELTSDQATVKIEMDTSDLLYAITSGGLTADGLRDFADLIDAS